MSQTIRNYQIYTRTNKFWAFAASAQATSAQASLVSASYLFTDGMRVLVRDTVNGVISEFRVEIPQPKITFVEA